MTRVVSVIVLSALALPGLSACQKSAAADPKAEASAIAAVEDAMRVAYREKDAAKLAATYASDATLYVPGELRPRVGADAIAKAAQKDFTDPAFRITFTTAKVDVSGDKGWTKGSFTIRYTDPKTKAAAGYSGYYLTLFAKQKDGSWKVIEDMATPAS
ncbi:MAG: SgcJ/EcaC family oxidoreductase [Sphingobium sp.]|nr:SgcJ/EcaC family oxidoreductase [Sphingobium sp.]